MAQFRVGQRVKIVNAPHLLAHPHWAGREVTILGLPGAIEDHPNHYEVSRPTSESLGPRYGVLGIFLAPLTDPKADEFIERLERLGREPQPEAPHVHRERVTNG